MVDVLKMFNWKRATVDGRAVAVVAAPENEAPVIQVGRVYPIMFGHGTAEAHVERLYPGTNGAIQVRYLAHTQELKVPHSEALESFVHEIKRRLLHDNCSVQSAPVDLGWLK